MYVSTSHREISEVRSESKVPRDSGFERWKVVCCRKDECGKRVHIEVIGLNDMTNVFVLFVSNLTAKGSLIFENGMFRTNEGLELL